MSWSDSTFLGLFKTLFYSGTMKAVLFSRVLFSVWRPLRVSVCLCVSNLSVKLCWDMKVLADTWLNFPWLLCHLCSTITHTHIHTHTQIVCTGCAHTHPPPSKLTLDVLGGHVGTQLMTIYQDGYPENSPYAFVIALSCVEVSCLHTCLPGPVQVHAPGDLLLLTHIISPGLEHFIMLNPGSSHVFRSLHSHTHTHTHTHSRVLTC